MAKPPKGVNPAIKEFLDTMLEEVKGANPETEKPYTLTDKMKVLDRCLKLAAIEAKMDTVEFGSALFEEEDDEPDEAPPEKVTRKSKK
jgi:hypothetical protein